MAKEAGKERLLAEIIRRILTVSNPQQVLLFGSHARGDATPDSDLDLLIIEEIVDHRRQRSVEIRRALRGLLVPIDVVVAAADDVEKYRDTPGMIYEQALREGQILYERASS